MSGWVRNRPDGSVEALAAGDEQAVSALIERMRRGPSAAKVERLTEGPSNESPGEGFVIRH